MSNIESNVNLKSVQSRLATCTFVARTNKYVLCHITNQSPYMHPSIKYYKIHYQSSPLYDCTINNSRCHTNNKSCPSLCLIFHYVKSNCRGNGDGRREERWMGERQGEMDIQWQPSTSASAPSFPNQPQTHPHQPLGPRTRPTCTNSLISLSLVLIL